MLEEFQIIDLGFELTKQYKHDQYNTNRYKLGFLEVEFTYENKELHDVSLSIEEVNAIPVTLNELLVLNLILNKE